MDATDFSPEEEARLADEPTPEGDAAQADTGAAPAEPSGG